MYDEAISVTLETAKNLGIKGINEFIGLNANDLSFSTRNVQDGKLKKYDTIDMSQSTLKKLLSGKIRNLKQIQNFNEMDRKNDEQIYRESGNKPFKSSVKYKIFYKNKYDKKINDYVQIIETIFLMQ